jgi:hypothetical protein
MRRERLKGSAGIEGDMHGDKRPFYEADNEQRQGVKIYSKRLFISYEKCKTI